MKFVRFNFLEVGTHSIVEPETARLNYWSDDQEE